MTEFDVARKRELPPWFRLNLVNDDHSPIASYELGQVSQEDAVALAQDLMRGGRHHVHVVRVDRVEYTIEDVAPSHEEDASA